MSVRAATCAHLVAETARPIELLPDSIVEVVPTSLPPPTSARGIEVLAEVPEEGLPPAAPDFVDSTERLIMLLAAGSAAREREPRADAIRSKTGLAEAAVDGGGGAAAIEATETLAEIVVDTIAATPGAVLRRNAPCCDATTAACLGCASREIRGAVTDADANLDADMDEGVGLASAVAMRGGASNVITLRAARFAPISGAASDATTRRPRFCAGACGEEGTVTAMLFRKGAADVVVVPRARF